MTRDDLLGTHQAHLAMISATPSHPKPLLVQGADAFVCCPFGKWKLRPLGRVEWLFQMFSVLASTAEVLNIG
jgi:hypothetical protein